MKTRIALLPLLMASASASPAQRPLDTHFPKCGGPFQLCGYVDRESGAIRIPQRFEVALPFSEGLAAVRVNGQYGFIDLTGRMVIQPGFEAVGPFTGDYAEVSVKGLSGAIDRTGKMVVPAKFVRLIPFANGTFIAKPLPPGATPHGAVEDNLRRLGYFYPLEGLDSHSYPYQADPAGLYHRTKGWLTHANLKFHNFDDPARGLIWAGRRNAHNDDKWGLLSADGTWRVTPRYGHVQRISETHAVVGGMPDYSVHWRERAHPPRGAVNREGELVVPLATRGLAYWRGGYGLATDIQTGPDGRPKSGGEGIVKADGSLLADRWFDKVEVRGDATLPRGRIGDKWFSIEPSGKLVADQLEGSMLIDCPSGVKIVQRGEGVEFRRANGEVVGQFDHTHLSKNDCPRPFATRRNGKWFYVLEDGTVLGGRSGFDSSHDFSGDHAAVKTGGKWGIINRAGAFTVKPRFDELSPVANGVFAALAGKRRLWIDARGVQVKPPVYQRLPPDEALTCEGGLRRFAADGLWGLRDADGKTVIEPRYRALSCFSRGVTWTAAPGQGAWCAVGPDGRQVEALACRKTYYSVWVSHAYPERFADDEHESSVLWMRAWLDYAAGTRAKAPTWIGDGERGSHSVIPIG